VISALALQHLKVHVHSLEHATTAAERLHFWRLIASCALDAHELECRALDDLKAPMADPVLTSSIGEPTV
jgi:hypothetical protein